MSTFSFRVLVAGCVIVAGMPRSAAAQTPPGAAPVERLSFDRPESWAMKYFTTTTILNGLETPDQLAAGSVAIGLETGWVPRLSTAQQRVGYYGTMRQDLNKAPILLRPRVSIGLPAHLAFTIAVAPPIRSFGVTPRLAAASLEGPLVERGAWMLGWRASGQLGTVTSAVETTQVAPTILQALGLDPNKLQGVQKEGTPVLPGLNFE